MSFFSSRRQNENPPPSTPQRPPQPERGQPQSLPTPSQPVGFETVLGANTIVEGVLRSSSNIRLDGTFTGTLEISGNVLVGETGKINADINAKNISIAGAVRGNVSGKKVQLLRTGRIWGDIQAQALTTEEGAFIDGKITMISRDSEGAPIQASEKPATAPTEPLLEPPAAPTQAPPSDAITTSMVSAATAATTESNPPDSEPASDDPRLAFARNDAPTADSPSDESPSPSNSSDNAPSE